MKSDGINVFYKEESYGEYAVKKVTSKELEKIKAELRLNALKVLENSNADHVSYAYIDEKGDFFISPFKEFTDQEFNETSKWTYDCNIKWIGAVHRRK